MRTWTQEINRRNRERSASGEADRKELVDIEKKMATMISVIEDIRNLAVGRCPYSVH